MAKNKAGTGKRLNFIAASDRQSGIPCVEYGFFGFPETDAKAGELYALNIEQMEWEVDITGLNVSVGDVLYWDDGFTADNTKRPVMMVTEILSDTRARAITLPQYAPVGS